jgi:hypothetical protein
MTLPAALQIIARALDARAADAIHTPNTLADALRQPIGLDDVVPWIRFDPSNYVRNLVCMGNGWELRLLCWRPGQATLLHGHGAAACSFRVLRGLAIETLLGARERRWVPGDVVAEVGPGLVHQLGNGGTDSLFTLHAYSPPMLLDAPDCGAPRSAVDA